MLIYQEGLHFEMAQFMGGRSLSLSFHLVRAKKAGPFLTLPSLYHRCEHIPGAVMVNQLLMGKPYSRSAICLLSCRQSALGRDHGRRLLTHSLEDNSLCSILRSFLLECIYQFRRVSTPRPFNLYHSNFFIRFIRGRTHIYFDALRLRRHWIPCLVRGSIISGRTADQYHYYYHHHGRSYFHLNHPLILLAGGPGLEPGAFGSGDQRSIQLS
jgi:hypothetical protein